MKKPQRQRREPTPRRPSHQSTPAASFADTVQALVAAVAPVAPPATLRSEPLAALEYTAELEVKNAGLLRFWQQHRLPGQPEPLRPAPRPRGYRTTSKRRTVMHGRDVSLLFSDQEHASRHAAFVPSPLEPPEHGHLYEALQTILRRPPYQMLAAHLNYVIIRGSYTERAVIFNVDTLNGPLVRKLKLIASHLQKLPEPVHAAFVYPDPSRSAYYLEQHQQTDLIPLKKLYGPDQLMVTYNGCRYRFPPTSFCQINAAMVPVLLHTARDLLAAVPAQHLLDLYCGYGLFSHFLAPAFQHVLGIDADPHSIRAAEANRRLQPGQGRTQFLCRRLTKSTLERLRPATATEAVLLDPPRHGPDDGVLAAIARRGPREALHIFCGVDHIPRALQAWQAGGYDVRQVVPLDMFPGTANLEVLVLLTQAYTDSR